MGAEVALTVAFGSVVVAMIAGLVFAFVGMPAATFAVAWALHALSIGQPVGAAAKALSP